MYIPTGRQIPKYELRHVEEENLDGVRDSIKLLLALRSANEKSLKINEKSFPSYAYLLNNLYAVPFHYAFTFEPLPYSNDMAHDVDSFVNIGFINRSSPISLSQQGEEWLDVRFSNFSKVYDKIKKAPMETWVKLDNRALFNLIYTSIAKM